MTSNFKTPVLQVLVIDPAAERQELVQQFTHAGLTCTLARGLHDAMVQCIIRNPAVIVADLTLAHAAGNACRQRLSNLPHFGNVVFVTIGTENADLPADVSIEAVVDHVCQQLSALENTALPSAMPATDYAPKDLLGEAPVADTVSLADTLNRLAMQQVSTTLVVTGSHNNLAEIMVRDGLPIHAVTQTGATGHEAWEAIQSWPLRELTETSAPGPETPLSLVPETPPPPQPPRHTNGLMPLLAKLEALGIIEVLP